MQNPGVTNWVETLGHRKGLPAVPLAAGVARAHRGRRSAAVELVDIDKVAAALPYYESNKISEEDWRARIALRQKQIGDRMVG